MSVQKNLQIIIFISIFITSHGNSGELGLSDLRLKNTIDYLNGDKGKLLPLDDTIFLTTSSIGGVGIIETPTARFREDGTMTIGMSASVPFNRSYFVIQALPRVEFTVKYNQIDAEPNNPLERWVKWFRFTGGSYTGRDKSFDARFKIFDETEKRPALAIGLTDLAGTNKFASEYLVASKSMGNFDVSMGLGFGAMGTRGHIENPLGWISDQFKRERGMSEGMGGTFNINDWFRSEKTAFFGSIQYATPVDNLNLQIEYDSKDFDKLFFTKDYVDLENKESNSPINVGLNYLIFDNINLNVGLVRGNTAYLNISSNRNLNTNFGFSKQPLKQQTISPLLPYKFEDLNQSGHVQLINRMMYMLVNEGITPHSITIENNELIAEISQIRFRKTIEAIDTASRILAENSTKEIEYITVSNIDKGIETFRSSIHRQDLVNSLRYGPLKENQISQEDLNLPLFTDGTFHFKNNFLFPNFSWGIRPNIKGIIGGRDHFYFWKLEALLDIEYSFSRNLTLTSQLTASIIDNFDDWVYEPTGELAGTLYRVRSDLRRFYRQGRNSIQRLQIDYLTKPGESFYTRISAGIFEDMYAGIGGEVLYLPQGKSWAIGLDAYWVKQRDYNQMLSFRDYDTFTGHLTLYQDIPFYDIRLKLSLGRFLAKDEGVNIDLQRRFQSGTVVGAAASFTNVTKKEFGEGSFSKWIYATIPLDIFSTFKTRNSTTMVWTPLTRDGGQPLHQNFRLYPLIKNANDEFEEGRTKNFSMEKIFSGFGTKPKERV